MTRTSLLVAILATPTLCSAPPRAFADTVAAARTDTAKADVSGTVVIRQADGSTRSAGAGVVVYFESSPALDERADQRTRTIAQRDLQFTPYLTVVPRGGTVDFPNEDRVFHNVFSLSLARRFDLGLYRDGETRSVTFERTGVVDIYCNIHPEMKARIKVVPNRFYAITDQKGQFRIKGVPAGSYALVAWNGTESRVLIAVRSAAVSKVQLELLPAPQSKRHQRKDGTPYRRYR